jgi:hypothetical protein
MKLFYNTVLSEQVICHFEWNRKIEHHTHKGPPIICFISYVVSSHIIILLS